MLLMLGSGRIISCLFRVRGSSTALIVNVPTSSSELNIAVHPTSFPESQLNPKGKKMIYTSSSGWFCRYLEKISNTFPKGNRQLQYYLWGWIRHWCKSYVQQQTKGQWANDRPLALPSPKMETLSLGSVFSSCCPGEGEKLKTQEPEKRLP